MHARPSVNNYFAYLGVNPKAGYTQLGHTHFSDFLHFEALLRDQQKHKATCVGPIVMYNQFERLPESFQAGLLQDRVIIHLFRRNLLRTHVSDMINKMPGVASHHTTFREKTSVDIPVKNILKILADRAEKLEEYKRILAEQSIVEITYEELSSNPANEVRRISSILGIDDFMPSTRLVRSNPFALSEIIENFDELRAVLLGTQFEYVLED